MASTSGCGPISTEISYPTQVERGPVSPSGSAKTRSPNSSAPDRSACSLETAGRLPTSSRSLATRPAMTPPTVVAEPSKLQGAVARRRANSEVVADGLEVGVARAAADLPRDDLPAPLRYVLDVGRLAERAGQ